MKEPVWLRVEALKAIHKRLVAEHGGIADIRDEGLLESALARPRNQLAYGETPSIAALAASYGFGIARNHPFVDGNKRAAFTAIAVFLRVNGHRFASDKMDALQTVMLLAAGEVSEADLADWIAANTTPRCEA